MPKLITNPVAASASAYNAELRQRIGRLQSLMARVAPVPEEWLEAGKAAVKQQGKINPTHCSSWEELEGCWQLALRMRRSMSDALVTMLAVAASTSQTGNQLFLQMIGDPGSAKTQFADAMLVSQNCHTLEHITGFHSGAKGKDGENLSLLNRINHKTLVTPEGDVLVASPLFPELMAQARRIFDGKSSATYKTSDEDVIWQGLRTPWIICGTWAMVGYWDQSRLGDRFLRVSIDSPAQDERRRIVHAAMDSEWDAVAEHSNGTSGGVERKLRHAYALTGGYVDWLRANVSTAIDQVRASETAKHYVGDLAEFVADMRARPSHEVRGRVVESYDSKELPTRVSRQLIRLSRCMSVVLNRNEVDDEVLRRVRKVALDSSTGRTYELLRWFYAIDSRTGEMYQRGNGVMLGPLARWCGSDETKLLTYLNFIQKIGVVEHRAVEHSNGCWRLTNRVDQLCCNIGIVQG